MNLPVAPIIDRSTNYGIVVIRREPDGETAELDVRHRLHRRDEFLPRGILAGAAQALDQHLRGDEPFEAREIHVDVAGSLREVEVL
jgi:hypothetical protein